MEAALKLNGTTVEDLELKVTQYKVLNKSRNTVCATNLKSTVTEAQLRIEFEKAGAIESIVIRRNIAMQRTIAMIRYADSDGFCKAFAYNEIDINGQLVFLEPYSEKKSSLKSLNATLHTPSYGNKTLQNGKKPFRINKINFHNGFKNSKPPA